jgi:hypothetical protein
MKPALALAACLLAAGSALYAAPSSPAQPSMSTPAPVWLVTDPLGICATTCEMGSKLKIVSWGATEAQCCSDTTNHCPAGYTQTENIFRPLGGGLPVRCDIVRGGGA